MPRLSDVGVTPKQSMQWQHVASIPEPVRQEYVETVKEVGGEVMTAGLVQFDLERRSEEQERFVEEITRGDQEMADLRYRAALSAALYDLHHKLLPLAVEPIPRLLDHREQERLLKLLADLETWSDRVGSALDSFGLEVIRPARG